MLTIEHVYDEQNKLIYKTYPYTMMTVTPNAKFKSWMLVPAKNRNISPQELDILISSAMLKDHSLAVLMPIITAQDQLQRFVESHACVIIENILKTWNIDLNEWPDERNANSLGLYFNINTNPVLCGMTTDGEKEFYNKQFYMISEIQANQPYIDWYNSIDGNMKAQKNARALEKVNTNSTALSYICHSSQELKMANWEELIKQNYMEIAKMWMYLGCKDRSLWPTWNDDKTFHEWFKFNMYPNVINLIT